MKKFLTLLMSVLVLVSMVALLSACGDNGKKDEDNENEKEAALSSVIEGTWNFVQDQGDLLTEEIAQQDATLAECCDFKGVTLTIQLIFDKDGGYQMSIEDAELDRYFDDMRKRMKAGYRSYFEKLIEENNSDYTVDELVQANTGMNLSDFVDSIYSEDMKDQMRAQTQGKGTYSIDGNKFFSAVDGEEIDEDSYVVCSATKTTIKVTEIVGDGSVLGDPEMKDLLPVVYNKK